jgi:hypothetical protein
MSFHAAFIPAGPAGAARRGAIVAVGAAPW